MCFEAPITAAASAPRMAGGKSNDKTEVYHEIYVDGKADMDVRPTSIQGRHRQRA